MTFTVGFISSQTIFKVKTEKPKTEKIRGIQGLINITCFKTPGSGFIFAASEYPSMTNKEIIQYTSVLFTQAPIRVCLDGTNIDSRTILITMYYCG